MEIHPSVKKILEAPVISQRSPEWFLYRSKRVTASECSIVLAQGKGYGGGPGGTGPYVYSSKDLEVLLKWHSLKGNGIQVKEIGNVG